MNRPSDPPRLAPPGAGVPLWQRLGGRYLLLPHFRRRISWDGAPDMLDEQGRSLIEMAAGRSESELTEPVLVPPQIGLEDSSRFFSYAMVLEHLTIIGDAIGRIVVELSHSRTPPGVVRTADLKPRGGRSAADAQGAYRDMIEGFRKRTLTEVGDRNSRLRFPHPWFGSLTAFDWLCFAPFHQTIHIEQATRILRRLNDH